MPIQHGRRDFALCLETNWILKYWFRSEHCEYCENISLKTYRWLMPGTVCPKWSSGCENHSDQWAIMRLSLRTENWSLLLYNQNSLQLLTHWGRDKMDAISQTKFSSAFSWMKMFQFQLRYHWCLFLKVQLTILAMPRVETQGSENEEESKQRC